MDERLKIRELAEDDRPREKLVLKGRAQLSNAELLAILIGSGNRSETAVQLSQRILNSINDNLSELSKMGVDELSQFKGVGEAKALSIIAALELSRRKNEQSSSSLSTISSSHDAFQLAKPFLSDLYHEEFWVILLNRANRFIEIKNISKGGVSGTVADSKLIFKAALTKLSSSIILCHNHPSGNLKPSKADLILTKKLVEGGKNLDIAVLDHLIIGNNSYFSFADQGLI